MSLKLNMRSTRYGAFVLTLANIASQLLGLGYRIALSRILGAEGMGLFQLIFPFYSLFMAVAVSGICVAVSRLSAEYYAVGNYVALRLVIRRALTAFFIIFALISAVSTLSAEWIAVHFLGDERTRFAVYMLVPVVMFTGVENIHKNYLYGTGSVNPPAISEIVEQIVRMGAVLILLELFMPCEEEWMLVCICAGMLTCEIVSSMLLRSVYLGKQRKLPAKGGDVPGMTMRILRTAAPVSSANLVNNILSALIVVLVPRRLVASGLTQTQALGEYGILFGMTMPLLSLPASLIVGIGLVMVPKLAENLALGNYGDLRAKVSRAIEATSFFVLPVIAVMVPLGESLGWFLYGQRVSEQMLLPLACGTVLSIYMSMFGSILNGLGRPGRAAIGFVLGNAVELVLAWILVARPEFRMDGYIIAFIVSTALTMLMNMYFVMRECHMRPKIVEWFVSPLLSSCGAALVARLLNLTLRATIGELGALVTSLLVAAGVYLLLAAFQGVVASSLFGRRYRRWGEIG